MAAETANAGSSGAFYEDAMNEAEQAAIKIARDVEGVDEELVVLRLRLRTLVQAEGFDLTLLLRSLDVLRRLVETKHKLTRRQSVALEAEQVLIRNELKQMLTEVRHDGNAGSNE
jgi:hypothetical protein